jgi:hypothetical protein
VGADEVPPAPDVEGPALAATADGGALPKQHGPRGYHERKAWLDAHRGFLLFASLVLLLVLVPFFERSELGQWLFAAMNLVVLTVSVMALGRSRAWFWVAVMLAGPAFFLLVGAYLSGSHDVLAWSWRFSVGVFFATLAHLVRYVLRPEGPEGIPVDRLYGGAAAYLLIGLLWCYLYALREHYSPGSFSGLDPGLHQRVADMVFLSFASLTTGGGADIVPQGKAARTLVMLEQIAGTLYLGAFVARLVGMYGARRR